MEQLLDECMLLAQRLPRYVLERVSICITPEQDREIINEQLTRDMIMMTNIQSTAISTLHNARLYGIRIMVAS